MTRDMTTGKPLRAMILFSIPVLLGNLLQQLYSFVDTLVVGRTLGSGSLGAVGSTGTLICFIIYFIGGLTNGFSVVLGQKFGAHDEGGVRRSAAATAMLSAAFAVGLTVLTVLLSRPVLELMKTPPDLIDEAYIYMVIIFAGIPATILYNTLSSMLRALGDSRTPLIFLAVSSGLNIALDFLLILAFGMGVAGAALATVASSLISGLACLFYASKRFPLLRFSKSDCKAAVKEFGAHLHVGLPMGLQMSVMSVGLIAMQAALNHLGSTVVSAFTVASKVENLAEVLPLSFSAVASTYVAQNYGAKKFRRIRTGVPRCAAVSIALALLATLMVELCCEPLITLFLKSPTAEEMSYATRFLRIVAPFYPFLSILIVCRSSVQSMGNSLVPFLACLLELCIRVGCALYAISADSYLGVCLATPCAWVGAAAFLLISYLVVLKHRPSGDAETPDEVAAK